MARELLARGDHARAQSALAVATEAAPGQPALWYNLACARARLGAKKPALDALERAVSAGYSDLEHMAKDGDLASLHGEARFQALVRAPSP
jgi:predicted Zn-dependent protease